MLLAKQTLQPKCEFWLPVPIYKSEGNLFTCSLLISPVSGAIIYSRH